MKGNCSGSHQGTKTQRIDLPAIVPLCGTQASFRIPELGSRRVWVLPPYLKSLPAIASSGEAGGEERIARKELITLNVLLIKKATKRIIL